MTAQVYCLLTAVLCLSVYLSTTDAAQTAVKPGACPSENLVGGACAKSCSSDSNCPGDNKCCSNGCGHRCVPPYIVKPGQCPKPKNIASCAACTYDGQCLTTLKCCPASCGQACVQPHGQGQGKGKGQD